MANLTNPSVNGNLNWTYGVAYVMDDVVSYGGKLWSCINNQAANLPFSTYNWMVLCASPNYACEWDYYTTYRLGDIITCQGGIYLLDSSQTSCQGYDPITYPAKKSTCKWSNFKVGTTDVGYMEFTSAQVPGTNNMEFELIRTGSGYPSPVWAMQNGHYCCFIDQYATGISVTAFATAFASAFGYSDAFRARWVPLLPGTWTLNMTENYDRQSWSSGGGGYWSKIGNTMPVIDQPTTEFYVRTAANGGSASGDGTVGKPWLTLQNALDFLKGWALKGGVVANIHIGDGTFASSSPNPIESIYGAQINIVGDNVLGKTLYGATSVAYVSGTSPSRVYNLTLNNTTGIVAGDYITVTGTAGGTNPGYIKGCFKVDQVINGSVIQITSTFRSTANPSGAITGTVSVYKTVLSYTGSTDGITVTKGKILGTLNKVCLVGTANNAGVGLNATYGSTLICGLQVACAKFGIGIQAKFGSTVIADGAVVSNCGNGFNAVSAGTITALGSVSSGNVVCGYVASSGSNIDLTPSTVGAIPSYASGNGDTGVLVSMSCATANTATAECNLGSGFAAMMGASINATSAIATANGGAGFTNQTASVIKAAAAMSYSNGGIGFQGIDFAYTYVAGAGAWSNGGAPYSPTINRPPLYPLAPEVGTGTGAFTSDY